MTKILSINKGVFIIINLTLGAGLVFQHEVFSKSGLIYGSLIYFFVGLLTTFSQIFLCFSAKNLDLQEVTYSQLAYKANRYLGIMTDCILFTHFFLIAIFYGGNLNHFINKLEFFDDNRLTPIVIILIIAILSF